MGCATSKQKNQKLCKNCQAPYIPVRRSYSMHSHKKEGEESFNLVALKSSSTLGSFKLDLFDQKPCIIKEDEDEDEEEDEVCSFQKKEEFVMGMVEAKTWSKMIDKKIPRIVPITPTRTPPGEPETINAWELMEGLEDISPLILKPSLNQIRSFSFNLALEPHRLEDRIDLVAKARALSNRSLILHSFEDYPTLKVHENGEESIKPLWLENGSNQSSIIGDYPTPKVHENGEESIKPLWLENGSNQSSIIKDYPTPKVHENGEESIKPLWLENGSNQSSIIKDYPTPKENENGEESIKPLWLENADDESNSTSNDTSIASEFDPQVIASFRKALEELPPTNPFHMKPINQVEKDDQRFNKKDKLIVYFTSLRGVRKTYEDCCDVRAILKGLGLKIDERDVSMHSGFKDELKELLLGEGLFTLPKVFIEKKCIGGAEEIRRMHEEGRLEKAVEGCESVDDGGGGIGRVCESCGDVRFVPCETCSGSCKIYYEGDYDEEEEESSCGFQPCPDCNENGLIRCPLCCD